MKVKDGFKFAIGFTLGRLLITMPGTVIEAVNQSSRTNRSVERICRVFSPELADRFHEFTHKTKESEPKNIIGFTVD